MQDLNEHHFLKGAKLTAVPGDNMENEMEPLLAVMIQMYRQRSRVYAILKRRDYTQNWKKVIRGMY